MSDETKKAKPALKKYRINAISMNSKYGNIIAYGDRIEIGTVSLLVLIFAVFVCAIGTFVLFSHFQNAVVMLLGLVLGAGFGSFLVLFCYPGHLCSRISYDNISSFVSDQKEFTIAKKDGKIVSPHMSLKKQEKLIRGIAQIMAESGTYHLEKNGSRYRIISNAK